MFFEGDHDFSPTFPRPFLNPFPLHAVSERFIREILRFSRFFRFFRVFLVFSRVLLRSLAFSSVSLAFPPRFLAFFRVFLAFFSRSLAFSSVLSRFSCVSRVFLAFSRVVDRALLAFLAALTQRA